MGEERNLVRDVETETVEGGSQIHLFRLQKIFDVKEVPLKVMILKSA